MFNHYLKIAVRNLFRHRGVAVVNAAGLAVGLACAILAFFFLRDEASYDRFHAGIDRLFEVKSLTAQGRESPVFLETQGPVGPTLASSFAEVAAATRAARADLVVRTGDRAFLRRALGVDSSFPDVFSFPAFRGDPSTALKDPKAVVLSAETARLLFGDQDPVGRTVSITIGEETADGLVSAVLREIPASSSLKFDLLLPIRRIKGPAIDQWNAGAEGEGPDAACFVLLHDAVDASRLEARFPDTIDKRLTQFGGRGRHYLFPFSAYHRGRREYSFSSVLEPRGNPAFAALLTAIAAFVLLIAALNFMNLNVGAAAADRLKEIGLRKVLGAGRNELYRQFRFEGLLLSLVSLAGGLAIAQFAMPAFNRFAGKGLRFDLLGPGCPLAALALLAGLLGAAAGSYPGWRLSRLRPAEALRKNAGPGRRGGFNRLFLGLQFGISMFLLIVAGFLSRQHRLLLRADLGYHAEHVAVVDFSLPASGSAGVSRALPAMKSRLMRHPGIVSVSGSYSGLPSWSARFVKDAASPDPAVIRFNEVDADFLETLGLRMSEGRWFSPERPADDREAVVVNEAFVRRFAPERPVGRFLSELFGGRISGRIIGVVRDFHYDSLRQPIQPAMITSLSGSEAKRIYIRFDGRRVRQAMEAVEREFKSIVSGYPFLWSFLDEDAARQYEQEARWSLMIRIVTAFAVLIACVGVFALAVQASARKIKEIGIRKVLGASLPRLIGLLGAQFMRTAAAAVCLAWPAAYLVVRKALASYPVRIGIGPGLFLAGAAGMMALTLATVGIQALRVARQDPIKALRSE